MIKLLSIPFVLLTLFCSSSAQVTFEGLLDEMIDRDELAKKPANAYTLGQASSYDRASTTPGGSGWYANGDGGGFIRTETNSGRTERVLMDVSGPGAIVRFWSTSLPWNFSNGKLRFYFDGSSTPAIEADFLDILSGTHLVDGILAAGTGGFREDNAGTGHILQGYNLYLPIPYASGCKVTYEGADNPFYFAINHRNYAQGTTVETFTMQDLTDHSAKITSVQQELTQQASVTTGTTLVSDTNRTIPAGQSHTYTINGARAIRQFMVNLEAENKKQALRSTVVEIKFDDVQKVWAPLGDFFCTGYQIATEFDTRYNKLTFDGRMTSRWVMPFQTKAEITIHNHGTQAITLSELQVHHSSWTWDSRSLYFHSSWKVSTDIASRPQRDTNYVNIQGEGKYVGDSLSIFNNIGNVSNPWWGEGDEKIYVDGEAFPSNFGTGTEDYYGYAWVGCATFSQPFLAQPIAAGNRARGLSVNMRSRALDAMPFNTSLRLDMEIWSWVTGGTLDYAPTTFWYGTAATRSVEDLTANPVVDRPLDLAGAQTAVKVVDRQEAEALSIGNSAAYSATVYTLPSDSSLGNRSQLLIDDLQVGEDVVARFYSDNARHGTLQLRARRSTRNMIVDVLLNGTVIITDLDLYGSGDFTTSVPNVKLLEKENTLTIRGKNTNPSNTSADEVLFDYIEFTDTTSPNAPVLTNPIASNTTGVSSDVSVTLSNQVATSVTLYWATADYGTNLAAWEANRLGKTDLGAQSIGNVTSNISGLTGDTRYFYRFYAVNATPNPDETAWSPSASFGTGFSSSQRVTDLAAVANTGRIDLTWSDPFQSESNFIVQRSDDGGNNYTTIATLPENTTSYADTGLAATTTYRYRVYATNSNGDSGFSNIASATTPVGPIVIADLAADYSETGAIAGTTPAVINTAKGTWTYASDTDTDPSAGLTTLVFRNPLGLDGGNGYGGTDQIFDFINNMPAISNDGLFDSGNPNAGELALHPGDDAPNNGTLVLRFSVTEAHVNNSIDYSLRNSHNGSADGVDWYILDDEFNVLTSGVLSNNTASGTIAVPNLAAGDEIYFVLGNGPANNPGADQTFASLTLKGFLPNTFANWTGNYNLGVQNAFSDDADNDGIANGVENFLGTSPEVASAGLNSMNATESSATFQHPQNPNPATDITTKYQWSTDLVSWHDSGATNAGTTVTMTPALNTPSTGQTTVTATWTSSTPVKLFFRLDVSQTGSP